MTTIFFDNWGKDPWGLYIRAPYYGKIGSLGISVELLGGGLQPPTRCGANLVVPLNIGSEGVCNPRFRRNQGRFWPKSRAAS